MELKEIVDLLVSNGIGVTCIVYFMVRDWKFMTTLQTILTQLSDTTNVIKEMLKERRE